MAGISAASFIVLFAVQGIGTVIYLFLLARLFNRLEGHHGAVHESLGRPSLFLNNNIRNNWLVIGWLWRKEFATLPDHETVRRATIVRVLFIALAVNFALMMVLFFAFGAAYES